MAAHEASHEAVLELFEPPYLRQLGALAGEQLLAQRCDGEHVEQSSIGIKRQCLDCPELLSGLGTRRRGSPSRARGCRHSAGEFQERSTIAQHFFLLLGRSERSIEGTSSGGILAE